MDECCNDIDDGDYADENDDKIDDDDDEDADENDDHNDSAGQIRRLWQPIKAFLLAPLLPWPVLAVMIIIRMIIFIYKIMKIMSMTTTMMVTMSMMQMTIMKIPTMKPIKAFLLVPLTGRCYHAHLWDDYLDHDNGNNDDNEHDANYFNEDDF